MQLLPRIKTDSLQGFGNSLTNNQQTRKLLQKILNNERVPWDSWHAHDDCDHLRVQCTWQPPMEDAAIIKAWYFTSNHHCWKRLRLPYSECLMSKTVTKPQSEWNIICFCRQLKDHEQWGSFQWQSIVTSSWHCLVITLHKSSHLNSRQLTKQ